MSIESDRPGYAGSYYALPLRGRLTPYEGGKFDGAPGAIPEGDAKKSEQAARKGGFSFAGFLDMINPLQHIPVISSIYRSITGDEITPAGRIAGGALFFGVIGLASAAMNAAIEKVTGKDVGDHVMTAMIGEKQKAPDDKNDGAANTLVVAALPEPVRGSITVIPKGGIAPGSRDVKTLDAATLDALSRTIGGPAPLAHLAPPKQADEGNKTPSPPALSFADRGAVTNYNDALIRMQQGLDKYQPSAP